MKREATADDLVKIVEELTRIHWVLIHQHILTRNLTSVYNVYQYQLLWQTLLNDLLCVCVRTIQVLRRIVIGNFLCHSGLTQRMHHHKCLNAKTSHRNTLWIGEPTPDQIMLLQSNPPKSLKLEKAWTFCWAWVAPNIKYHNYPCSISCELFPAPWVRNGCLVLYISLFSIFQYCHVLKK